MTAPASVLELIERFKENRASYKSGSYNETQVRREFIDPLFEALGWDVNNKNGYAEAYKEVVHEDAIKIGGQTKAPDYAFRIGGVRKFFLEAKKPSVNIKDDISPAFQLRRYAWSAKLPLSVLTDFEEFAVYDCRIKPEKGDKASVARILYMTFDQLIDRWDDIKNIFSRDAILKGSFDKYADDNKKKRGTSEVDVAFLNEIENWRSDLAHNISLRNPNLSTRELNAAVQITIDRIIFLRITEDRGIEKYGRLQNLVEGKDVYARLSELYKSADERYNSGLFHFRKEDGSNETLDTFTLSLSIDDKVLKGIFKSLYYPESPYEFSVLPADILGKVYEQFLGKIIQVKGKKVVIEEKPEVKKAGGVYYTPSYIVEYIIDGTVNKFLDGKSPIQVSGQDQRAKDAAPLRIIDPACGSGSFLIVAYQRLLDWYLEKYLEEGPEKNAKGKEPKLYQSGKGGWRLTISEKRRILLAHIYGVDIDTQAVEVTKLSLLLKVLEGESGDAIASQMDLFKQRVLPDLGKNIRCGNSLISSDFYNYFQMSMFNQDERIKINTFDWKTEFSNIFKKDGGGFDAVIGNPPYLYSAGQDHSEYFSEKYKLSQYQTDFYVYFIEKGLDLLKPDGTISYIVPDSWLNADSFSTARKSILTDFSLEEVTVFKYQVFEDATIENTIFRIAKKKPAKSFDVVTFENRLNHEKTNKLVIKDVLSEGIISVFSSKVDKSIITKIDKFQPLGKRFELNRGIHAYRTDGFGKSKFSDGVQTSRDKDEKSYHSKEKLNETYLPEIKGKDVHWMQYRHGGEFLSYGDWLAEPRDEKFFKNPKVVVRKVLGKVLSGSLIKEPAAIDQSLYIVISKLNKEDDLLFILGILLSKVGAWYLRTKHSIFDILYPWYTKKQLSAFPIPDFDIELVNITREIQKVVEQSKKARSDVDKGQSDKELRILEQQLNSRVSLLYGLSPEEFSVIDEASN